MRRLLSNESENRRKLQLLSAIMIITGYLILYAVFQITSNSEKHNISQEADEVLEFLQSSCRNMMITSLAIRLKICRIYS